MSSKAQHPFLTIGLDIGIASVGWAILSETRIINLGVRCFDKAETAKEGESLNLARRMARLLRRRLRRRAWRLTKLSRLLKKEGLIADVAVLKNPPTKGFATPNLWQLRTEALDRLLAPEEWARVLYHIVKHRGFHWVSKAEEKAVDGDGEGGKVKKGLAGTKKLMVEKNYRTAAEMVVSEFPNAQRNKHGDYSKALSRVLLAEEMDKLFEAQRTLGNPHATQALQKLLLGTGDRKSGLLWSQKPSLSGGALLKMLGKCTFEKTEYRAPKASFTAERHVWLTRLNNIRITLDGTSRPLNDAELALALPLPYNQASDLSYKQLRNALVKAGHLPEHFRFNLTYPSAKQVEEQKAKNPEDEKLIQLKGWHAVRQAFKDADLDKVWQKISVDAIDGKPELLDTIAWVLSVYKEDDEVERELAKLGLDAPSINALLTVRFDKFSNLSLKALYKIVPHMNRGLRYDEACIEAGYHHSQLHELGAGEHKYLPPFYSGREKNGRLIFNEEMNIPRNPVVLRALNQARKVVNALIKTYGSPHRVHIELARDLSKPFDERRDIKKAQDEFRDRNEKDRITFKQEFNTNGELKGREFEKWQLYREQQGKCAYSIEALDINRLFEKGYAEIDHALPYSRSFDDSKNNRVLVLTRENRNKGNQTPYEYLDGVNDNERWRQFVAFVEGNKTYRQAKRSRLLRKDFGDKEALEFRDRNLNDTRYICKFFKNYVEKYLKLADDSEAKRCVVVNGQLTSFLRARWGLIKVRSDSDRHHALDAAVVAACSHGMVKRLADYSRRKELEHAREGFVDMETGEVINPEMLTQLEAHFPAPWAYFRDELIARLNIDDADILRSELQRLGSYADEDLQNVKPLFVSRAVQRRNSGAAHKETIYAQPESLKKQGGATQKIAVQDLTMKDIDKLIDPHRNEKLYTAITQWLEGKDEREKRAKAIETSVGRGKDKRPLTIEEQTDIAQLRALPRKPINDGTQEGPIVRTVTMVIDKLSGIPIRGGVAKNDTMLRVDVFNKAGKFHLVPVYVHHAVAKELPIRAIVAAKDEAEWTLIDESFVFCFALYSNDLVRVTQRNNEIVCGYFRSCHSGTGAISVALHDRNAFGAKTSSLAFHNKQIGKPKEEKKSIPNDKLGLIESMGVKTALSLEKLNVDVLGNIYPAPSEVRRGLA